MLANFKRTTTYHSIHHWKRSLYHSIQKSFQNGQQKHLQYLTFPSTIVSGIVLPSNLTKINRYSSQQPLLVSVFSPFIEMAEKLRLRHIPIFAFTLDFIYYEGCFVYRVGIKQWIAFKGFIVFRKLMCFCMPILEVVIDSCFYF